MKEEITFSPEYIEQLVRIIARYCISNDNAEKWFKLPKGLVSGWKHEFYQNRKPEALSPETWLLSDARCNTLYGDLSKRFRPPARGPRSQKCADPAFDASAIKVLRIEDRVFQKKHWNKIIEHAGKFAHVERIDLLNAPEAEMENFWSAFPGVAEVNFHKIPTPKSPGRNIGLKAARINCSNAASTILNGFFNSIFPALEELEIWLDEFVQHQDIEDLMAFFEARPFPNLRRLNFLGGTGYDSMIPMLSRARFVEHLDALQATSDEDFPKEHRWKVVNVFNDIILSRTGVGAKRLRAHQQFFETHPAFKGNGKHRNPISRRYKKTQCLSPQRWTSGRRAPILMDSNRDKV